MHFTPAEIEMLHDLVEIACLSDGDEATPEQIELLAKLARFKGA